MRPRVNGPRSLIGQLIDRPVSMTVTSTIEPSRRVRWAQPICDETNRCPSARREPDSEPYILAIPSSPQAGPQATTNKSSRPLTPRHITPSQVGPLARYACKMIQQSELIVALGADLARLHGCTCTAITASARCCVRERCKAGRRVDPTRQPNSRSQFNLAGRGGVSPPSNIAALRAAGRRDPALPLRQLDPGDLRVEARDRGIVVLAHARLGGHQEEL